jgi:hypothetical protein
MKAGMTMSGAGEMRICAAFSCDACAFVQQNHALMANSICVAAGAK